MDRLVHGDRNTSFYHIFTLAGSQKNHIVFLVDSNGVWKHEVEDVASNVREWFISLFTTSMEVGHRRQWDIANWLVRIFYGKLSRSPPQLLAKKLRMPYGLLSLLKLSGQMVCMRVSFNAFGY